MKEIDFDKLLHSITYWLSYQERIGRSFMIQENSLKYPLADYLTGLGYSTGKIALEFPHPKLKNRRIDLVKSEIEITDKQTKIDFVAEFKMATYHTKYESEQRRIFNDLMRLYLTNNKIDSSSYFIICGKQTEYINSFRSIVIERPTKIPENKPTIPQPYGFYAEKWFGYEQGEVKTFIVKNEQDKLYKSIYNGFLNEYLPKDENDLLDLPNTITTRCISATSLSRKTPMPYVGGIWKVE